MKCGCYWCKFRRGMKCCNKHKLKVNGFRWNLATSLLEHGEDPIPENLKKPMKSTFHRYYGCNCIDFEPKENLIDETQETVVFS